MTKNGRRATFLLVATLGNMLLTLVLIVGLVAAWALIANATGLKAENTMAPALLVAFIAAIVLSGFIYSRVLKALQKRPDLVERYGLLKK
jgi:hypothetical protein